MLREGGFGGHDLSALLLASTIMKSLLLKKVLSQYQVIYNIDKRYGKGCSRKINSCQCIFPIMAKKSIVQFENMVPYRQLGTNLGNNVHLI